MRLILLYILLICGLVGWSQYPPAANQAGTTAIHKDSSAIVGWADAVVDFQREYQDIANPSGGFADHGDSTAALGYAEGNGADVVSLGDAGWIVLTFPFVIENRPGADFAVFENSFSHDFLELAHVEVSSDGQNFVRIPSVSLTPTDVQTGSFGYTDPTKIHNLAGKYIQGYGTPFDLEDIADSTGINIDSINYVKVIDVVGSINSTYGSYDSQGNLINDPYPTAFGSGGFDLDGVGVMHAKGVFANATDFSTPELTIYPNPSADVIYFSETVSSVRLYNLQGQLIFEDVNLDRVSLCSLGVPEGMYLLHCDGEVYKVVYQF